MTTVHSMDKEVLKKKLTPEQYAVTQEQGTERPFANKYFDLKDDGMYHCVVCDAVLFDSETKFDSGTGWPSFSDVVKSDAVITVEDTSHGMTRTEVRCANCDAHLGHVFNDGPTETGQRFCINSAALNFKKKDAQTS